MRPAFATFAVIIGTSFLVACGRSGTPTGPAPLSASPSALQAGSQVDHTLPDDDIDTVVNPCTGLSTTVTLHFVKFTQRSATDPNGGEHIIITAILEVTTADGFSGRATFHITGLRDPASTAIALDHEAQSATLRNGSGQLLVVRTVAQDLRFDGTNPTVEFDEFVLECVGRRGA